jgi:hypothetical protein
VAGKTRCKFHGGKSTGPTSPEGLAASSAAGLVHGGRAQLGPYLRALGAAFPELYEDATTSTKLGDEVKFLRAKLAALALRAAETGKDMTEATMRVMAELRLAIATQHEIHPTNEIGGKFELQIKIVEGAAHDEDGRRYLTNEHGHRFYEPSAPASGVGPEASPWYEKEPK